ncbi:MAG: nucleotidyltransferase family protein [Porphyromonadaceae bacterium]|nr:nucleotidyltransferase family protein [Porphyromonadaceae bacterium]
MTVAEHRFLHLLSCAIWAKEVDTRLFEGLRYEEWQAIERLARSQSVPALVAERILSLPAELLPERMHCIRLAMQTQTIELGNKQLMRVLGEVFEDYEREDFPFVLLKGQTVAYYYPNPHLRSPGDLDLYLYRPGDYERANRWAYEAGYRLQGSSFYEQLYWRGKVAVENHRYIAYFGRKKYDDALAKILAPLSETDTYARLELGGRTYRTLPAELNAVYIFQHILHHFCYLGIGMRQVCDWFVFLDHHKAIIDIEHFQYLAHRLDLLRPMRFFALMGVRYLGVDETIFPFDLPEDDESQRLSDLILSDIFRGGNFGLDTFAGKKFRNIWLRRWFMFHKTLRRSFRVGPISPEHIRLTPLIAVLTRLRLLFHRSY